MGTQPYGGPTPARPLSAPRTGSPPGLVGGLVRGWTGQKNLVRDSCHDDQKCWIHRQKMGGAVGGELEK